ncbi:unnamed protein product [Prorocentrum cordatum]|uniref:Polycystin cation channel PKD1/PKD2 domain-containing protein n=1 Tax=Prorocentrum cordatum TaxID=2364126 RepID=A0ABN9PAL9_9DINO|nr:unnamed protein product [Polarella glacialis]
MSRVAPSPGAISSATRTAMKANALPNSLWRDRLYLELRMRKMLPQAMNFLVIITLFLFNLAMERPVGAMNEIKENFRFHFNLDNVNEVNNFQGMYSFLYEFLEAAERFDPLDVDKYVEREYDTPVFTTETEMVYLTKLKRFTAVTAVVVRPQIWMTRREIRDCTGFATMYDRIYSLARHLRFKYRGDAITGAWQPTSVVFRRAEDVPYEPIGIRSSEQPSGPSNPPPPESQYTSPNAGRSVLLTCTSSAVRNRTMRNVLKTKFNNVALVDGDRTFFGDFHADKVDILAYMGYNVYANAVNLTTHPRCFMTSKRNEHNQIEWSLDDDGNIDRHGEKVTVSDVDERCERSADTWHDVQTDRVRAQVFLYTPSYELFTRILVEWHIERSGKFTPSFHVESFQELQSTDRYTAWISLTLVQVGLGVLQLILILRRVAIETRERRLYPRASTCTNSEKIAISCGFLLQIVFMVFYITRLAQEMDGGDLWPLVEKVLSINPYASEEAAMNFMSNQNALVDRAQSFQSLRVTGFVIVFVSFLQIVDYMSVHPQLGVIPNTLSLIVSQLINWIGIFVVVFLMLVMLGHWAFGEQVDDFSSVSKTLVLSGNLALGNFDFMALESELHETADIVLLVVWESAMLALVFLVLLNFLLAIVVDGYAVVKGSSECCAANGFLTDLFKFGRVQYMYNRRGWPKRALLIEHLMELPDRVTAEDIHRSGAFRQDGDGSDGMSECQVFFDAYLEVLEKLTGAKADEERRPEAEEPGGGKEGQLAAIMQQLEAQMAARDADQRARDADLKASLLARIDRLEQHQGHHAPPGEGVARPIVPPDEPDLS